MSWDGFKACVSGPVAARNRSKSEDEPVSKPVLAAQEGPPYAGFETVPKNGYGFPARGEDIGADHMRVPVRHNWTIAVVFAAFLIALAGAAITQAEPLHATTAEAVQTSTQATQPPAEATQTNPTAEHATQPPAEPTQPPAAGSAAEHQTAAAGEHKAAPGEEAAAEHSNPLIGTIARLFNFALLAGSLFYLLRSPIAVYLTTRSTQIRERLVKAGDMRTAAAAEQAAIAEKMQTLPAELEALRKTGAEEVAAEEARIRQAAEAERERLLVVTRREISTQLKLAERALTKQAADLAVAVASERVKTTITDADQVRLVDRYLVQVGK